MSLLFIILSELTVLSLTRKRGTYKSIYFLENFNAMNKILFLFSEFGCHRTPRFNFYYELACVKVISFQSGSYNNSIELLLFDFSKLEY